MAKKENYEKKFYKKILNSINRNDEHGFYKEFHNSIRTGKMAIDAKRSKSQLAFDATWVETITRYMGNLEKIVRNPRLFMQANEEILSIQAAKKINSRSVQHLASHVQNVQSITKSGQIVPSKVLTTVYDDTLNIYENRFIMTLITKLAAFIEIRYNAILNDACSFQTDELKISDHYTWRNFDIKTQISYEVKEKIEDEVSKRNQQLLDQIKTLRAYTKGFMSSQFFANMKEFGAKPVTPPILRTNILVKQVDYSSCLKLWQFIDSYRQLGIDTGEFSKDLKIDEKFVDEIADMLLVNYSLIANNQEDRADTYEMLPYKYHVLKAPRVNRGDAGELLTVIEALDEQPDKKELSKLDEPTISEYFYQRIKANYKTQYTKQVNSGISANKSFLSVYRKMQKIENGVSREIIEGLERQIKLANPTRTPKAVRAAFLRKQKTIYTQVLLAKNQDIERIQQKLATIEEELAKKEGNKKK